MGTDCRVPIISCDIIIDGYEHAVWEKIETRRQEAELARFKRLGSIDPDTSLDNNIPDHTADIQHGNGNTIYEVDEDMAMSSDIEIVDSTGRSMGVPKKSRPVVLTRGSGSSVPPAGPTATTSVADGSVSQQQTQPQEDSSEIWRLTLRGKEGEVKVSVKKTTKVSSLLVKYAKDLKIDLEGEVPSAAPVAAVAPLSPQPPPPPPKKRGKQTKVALALAAAARKALVEWEKKRVAFEEATAAAAASGSGASGGSKYKLAIEVEGERLAPDSEIGECEDIEDGIMVDVIHVS